MNPQRQQLEIPWTIPAPDTDAAAPEWCEGDRITLSNAPGTVWEIVGLDGLSADLISVSPKVGTRRTAPVWQLRDCSCVSPETITHEQTHEHWVQVYKVTRGQIRHEYFRYCYLQSPGDIRSCVRVHIPGGNSKSAIALARKAQIEDAIASLQTPDQIQSLIKSWRQPA